MGRSVSKHQNALTTFFTTFECEEDSYYEWNYFVEDIQSILSKKYKSLKNSHRWVDRENRIILENEVAEISVSEYCGGVAICLAPNDIYNPLHKAWCLQIHKGFHDLLNKHFQGYRLVGYFSNGEGVYEQVR